MRGKGPGHFKRESRAETRSRRPVDLKSVPHGRARFILGQDRREPFRIRESSASKTTPLFWPCRWRWGWRN